MPTLNRPAGRSDLSLTLYACGKRRDFSIGRWTGATAFALISAMVIWSLLSGAYVVFHDQLMASLMSRQADMQYAYEDQIATLRTELENSASRHLMDRRLIETALQDLVARSGRLELRATTIDKLMTDGMPTSCLARSNVHSTDPIGYPDRSITVAPLPTDMRPEPTDNAPAPPANLRLRLDGDRASLQPDVLSARFARIETRQLESVTRLRDPLLQATHKLAAALADTGLSHRVLAQSARDVGGPFVPLPGSEGGANGDSRDSFDLEVAKTREALDQRGRLWTVIDRVPLRDPLEGPIEVSSSFGARVDPFLGRPALHTGIDLRETANDAVHATAAGVVTIAGPNGGYGNMVEIDHGNGLVTRYAHLSAIEVTPRQRVATGAIVGRVGSTGRATGPHLHYETRVDGEPVDPATFLIAGRRLAGE